MTARSHAAANILLVVLLALVLAVTPAGAQSDPPPQVEAPGYALLVTELELDFIFRTNLSPRLVVIESDGSVRRLVQGQASNASWSPDGNRVAYFADLSLWVVDRDGGAAHGVLADAVPARFAWSPDGTELLATRVNGPPYEIVAVNPDSGAVRALVSATDPVDSPAWSPDGSRLAYIVVGGPGNGVWVVDRDGSGARRLTTDLEASGPLSWSPAGDRIAVAGAGGRPFGSGVHVIDVAAGGHRVIPGAIAANGFQPLAWSPAGDRIAASVCEAADGCPQLALVDPDGEADPQVIPPVAGAQAVTLRGWADGQRLLAVQSLESFDYQLSEVDVSGPQPVTRLIGPAVYLVGDVSADTAAPRPPLAPTTAAALHISRDLPAGSAPTVLLGRSDEFADSLASGGAQGALDAPLLLTDPDQLDGAVAAELARLGAERVVLLGGEQALSTEVQQALGDAGLATERLAGPTRVLTAIAVAEALLPAPRRVLLARAFGDAEVPSRAYADSLAGGAAAAGLQAPLLLTDSEALSTEVADYLNRTPSVGEVVVLGGTAAVSDDVVSALGAHDVTVIRVAGPDRFATAAAVSRFAAEADAGDDDPPAVPGTFVVVDADRPEAWAEGLAAARLADPTGSGGVLLASGGLPQPSAGRLADAVAGSTVRCASLLAVATCRDAQAAVATADPDMTLRAYATEGGVIAEMRIQQADGGPCVLAAVEGAELVAASIRLAPAGEDGEQVFNLDPPGDAGRIVFCNRQAGALFGLTVERLTANNARAVFELADGRVLEAPLLPE